MNDSFRGLLARIRHGDEEAARVFTNRYGEAMRREIRFRLRDQRLQRVVGESDVLQSALAQFFLGLQLGKYDLDCPEDVVKLLKTIAMRRVCSEARYWYAERRDVRRNVDVACEASAQGRVNDLTPSGAVSQKELTALMTSRLPKATAKILQWRRNGDSWHRIAQRLPGTSSSEAIRKRCEREIERIVCDCGLREF